MKANDDDCKVWKNRTKKLKAIKPYSPYWERLANYEARSYCPAIRPCKHCNYPVLDGYCCHYCGSSNP